ncbi:MAG: Hsp33 family molecular chaperone HslO [Fibrobacterota bacterium]|nr:Hsp33 family molecular chaperone HslO [Fibrobacterota bacterium]
MSDKIIRATGETAEIRFVLVDATDAANIVAGYHGAHAFARILLGETIISSLLLASGLKTNGTVQVKFKFSGDFSLVTADATPMGLLRGMLPAEDVRTIGDFEPLLSPQTMTVRKLSDRGVPTSEGIVEMPSEHIGPSTAYFLLQSEQTKSAVGIKAKCNSEGSGLEFCGGFLVEAFPKADEKTLAIMEQVVRTMPPLEKYHVPGKGMDLDAMLSDLAGPFKYAIHREIAVQPFCPCSEAGVMKAMTGLPREELEEICIKNETTELHCEYCRKRYVALPEQVRALLERMDGSPSEDEA